MLILTRRIGETLRIGDDVSLMVLGIQGNQVRIGADAPRDVAIHREEIYRRIQNEKAGIPVEKKPQQEKRKQEKSFNNHNSNYDNRGNTNGNANGNSYNQGNGNRFEKQHTPRYNPQSQAQQHADFQNNGNTRFYSSEGLSEAPANNKKAPNVIIKKKRVIES